MKKKSPPSFEQEIASAFAREVEDTYFEILSIAEWAKIPIEIQQLNRVGYWELLDSLYRATDGMSEIYTLLVEQELIEASNPNAEEERIKGFLDLEKLKPIERIFALSTHLHLSLLAGRHDANSLFHGYKSVLIRLGIFYEQYGKPTKPTFSHSEIGKLGATKRHLKTYELKEFAIDLYKKNEWKSASAAAKELKQEIMSHGRKIGRVMSDDNAQRTISEWIRNEIKNAKKLKTHTSSS